jgi:hypothetical protein
MYLMERCFVYALLSTVHDSWFSLVMDSLLSLY